LRTADERAVALRPLVFHCPPFKADARIDERERDIGEQEADERQEGARGEEREDDRIVARQHRLVAELSDSGDRENPLDDHRAADQAGQDSRENRHHRDQRVSQHVLAYHRALRNSFGARRANEVLARVLEHGGAHVARELCVAAERGQKERHREVVGDVTRSLPQ
jgi:hypothetical protein